MIVSVNHLYKKLNIVRKTVQLFTLLFLFAIPILILFEVRFIIGNLYSISIGGLDITDPSMVLQNILLSRWFMCPFDKRDFSGINCFLVWTGFSAAGLVHYNTILEETERIYSKISVKFLKKTKIGTNM